MASTRRDSTFMEPLKNKTKEIGKRIPLGRPIGISQDLKSGEFKGGIILPSRKLLKRERGKTFDKWAFFRKKRHLRNSELKKVLNLLDHVYYRGGKKTVEKEKRKVV